MRIKTTDLIAFAYCPFMFQNGGTGKLVPPLTYKESILRESILGAEQRALDKESYVTTRKIGNVWEKLWWPAAAKLGISIEDTEKISIQMTNKMVDYCRYDISGPTYEIIGIDIQSEVKLGKCILDTQIDIVKMPLFEGRGGIFLIDFKRKGLTQGKTANDIAVLANMYAFKDLDKPLTYVSVDISENLRKVTTTSTYYEPEDLERVGKTLKYLAEGIYKGIDYQYIWMCEHCNKCRKS